LIRLFNIFIKDFSTFDRKPESYRRLDLWNTNKDTINNLLIKSQQSSL